MATRRLCRLLQTSPDIEDIDITNCNLYHLENEVKVLQHFKKLRHLDVSRNPIQYLPSNFSTLKTLISLNVSDTELKSLSDMIPILQQLPALKSLNVTLRSEKEKMLVLTALKGLRILNGTPLPTRSVQLCSTQSSTAAHQMEHKSAILRRNDSDKTKNRSVNVSVVSPVSVVGKFYTHSHILPKYISKDYMEEILTTFNTIKKLYESLSLSATSPPGDVEIDQVSHACQRNLHLLLMSLEKNLEKNALDDKLGFLQASEVLRCKVQMNAANLHQAARYAGENSPDFGLALQSIQTLYQELFQSYHSLVLDMQMKQEQDLILKKSETEEVEGQVKQLLHTAELLESEALMNTEVLQKQVDHRQRLITENESLRHEIDRLKAKIYQMNPTKSFETSSFIKSRTAEADGNAKNERREPKPTSSLLVQRSPSREEVQGNLTRKETSKSVAPSTYPLHDLIHSNSNSNSSSKPKPKPKPQPESMQDPMVVKYLSLKQLKELMQQIYASKKMHDRKCMNGRLPKETLEQHMYTYLNFQFGLKSLIVEYASAITKAAAIHSQEDNDVAVFRMILKNEIDEGFLEVQKRVKNAVVGLLTAYLRGKHANKREKIIQEMVSDRCDGFLLAEEYTEIVQYMYHEKDSREILRLIERARGVSAENDDHEHHRIEFNVFRKILLDFQLNSRWKLLHDFYMQFHEIDTENLGILSRSQFKTLIQRFFPEKTRRGIEESCLKLDPFHTNSITYSDAVSECFDDIVSHYEKSPQ